MKYHNIEDRLRWEASHRKIHVLSKQMYYMIQNVKGRQEFFEESIAKRQAKGQRLTKKMRSYLNSKKRVEENRNRPLSKDTVENLKRRQLREVKRKNGNKK